MPDWLQGWPMSTKFWPWKLWSPPRVETTLHKGVHTAGLPAGNSLCCCFFCWVICSFSSIVFLGHYPLKTNSNLFHLIPLPELERNILLASLTHWESLIKVLDLYPRENAYVLLHTYLYTCVQRFSMLHHGFLKPSHVCPSITNPWHGRPRSLTSNWRDGSTRNRECKWSLLETLGPFFKL